MGSPGIEETKWLKPVRPDMPLTLRIEILEKRVSKSRPEMGIIRMNAKLLDAKGTPVIDQTSTILIGVRDPGEAAA
jgi:acyl dehydratase